MANELADAEKVKRPFWGDMLEDRDTLVDVSIAVGLSLVLIVAYFNSLRGLVAAWNSPQYSHGYLVPLFAAVLLWLRREPLGNVPSWQRWLGVGLLTLSIITRVLGTQLVIFTVERFSFVPGLLGIFIIAGGLRSLRWAGPPIMFLVFMYPLPRVIVDGLLRPLQSLATGASLYTLQTLGVEAYREGNRIVLEHMQMGVVDQCSGLRMLTIFLALAFAIAMISTSRPWWERIVVVLSAVPIALAVNIIRITLTGLLYNLNIQEEIAHKVMHDWAGFIMMPLALGLLFLEMQILSRLLIEEATAPTAMAGFGAPVRRPDSGRVRRR